MAYPVALFLHILGALGLFAALGLEWTVILRLRRVASADLAREWFPVLGALRVVYALAFALILIAGLYMTITTWTFDPVWIKLGLATLILIAAFGGVTLNRAIGALNHILANGANALQLRAATRNPLLLVSVQTRVALALGVVFLMTLKPDLGSALLALGVALIAGLASTVNLWRGVSQTAPAM